MSIDRRILIADDDAEVRLGAAELLASLGLEILQADSGDHALTIVRRERIHLALLDYHMPGCDGFQVFHTLREVLPDVPCIFWSGHATDAIEKIVLRDGASAFLRKPVRPDLLRGEVRRVLDAHWGPAA